MKYYLTLLIALALLITLLFNVKMPVEPLKSDIIEPNDIERRSFTTEVERGRAR